MTNFKAIFQKTCVQNILAATTLVAGLLWGSGVQAQQAKPPGTVEQFQLWNQFSAIRDITPGMRGYVEVWPRFRTRQLNQTPATLALSPTGFQLDRLFTGLWLVFPLNESNTIRAGMRAIVNTATQTRRFDETETRFLQEHIGAYPMGDVVLSTRTRLEERLLPNRQSPSFRFRTRLGIEVPLDQDRNWWFIVNDETLINVNDAGSVNLRPGLGENRAIVGFRTKLAPGIGMEFAYQNNLVIRDTAFDDVKHCLLLNFSFDIDQIENANAKQRAVIDASKKVAMAGDALPVEPSKLPEPPVIESAKPSEAKLTNKAVLSKQASLSASDLNAPEDFDLANRTDAVFDGRVAVFQPGGGLLVMPSTAETHKDLSEVQVVAARPVKSRAEQRKEDLNFSMIMNTFDGDGGDGSP
ncbi:MAG: DUF2490 domain-containing protein [Anaerolineae bacterium]|nr:DUF2490 domain-containing protein [Gloeobacterales cyanobacterium ES-bin-313]